MFLSSRRSSPCPQALTQFVDAYGGPMWDVQLAAASLTALPVLIVFVIAQRQFVEGLSAGTRALNERSATTRFIGRDHPTDRPRPPD